MEQHRFFLVDDRLAHKLFAIEVVPWPSWLHWPGTLTLAKASCGLAALTLKVPRLLPAKVPIGCMRPATAADVDWSECEVRQPTFSDDFAKI